MKTVIKDHLYFKTKLHVDVQILSSNSLKKLIFQNVFPPDTTLGAGALILKKDNLMFEQTLTITLKIALVVPKIPEQTHFSSL